MADIEQFLQPYIGAPYTWCLEYEEGGRIGSRAPFWRLSTLPTPEEVKAEGCCCVGVINFVRIDHSKLTFAGTGHISDVFDGFIKPIQEVLPVGAMLLRRPRDEVDQGHVAIVISGQRLMHCYVENPEPVEGLVGPGVEIDASWKESHSWHKEGYYDGYISVEDWLARDE